MIMVARDDRCMHATAQVDVTSARRPQLGSESCCRSLGQVKRDLHPLLASVGRVTRELGASAQLLGGHLPGLGEKKLVVVEGANTRPSKTEVGQAKDELVCPVSKHEQHLHALNVRGHNAPEGHAFKGRILLEESRPAVRIAAGSRALLRTIPRRNILIIAR